MTEFFVMMLGVLYGLLIGVIPAAGATTGLIAIFSFLSFFPDPYLAVIFCMAVVASSTTGDSYTAILLGIPGANSAAATVVDGYPLAQNGEAVRALSAAVTTSTLNGLLWGFLVFLSLPYYEKVMLLLGIPELWAFALMAMSCVVFISSKNWFRGILALSFGLFLGAIGTDPNTASERFTIGWFYLEDGIQIMPVVAGLFAIPELIDGFKKQKVIDSIEFEGQTKQGILDVWKNKWLALRGGFIGAFIGALPALGGAVADWIAYGQAVATTKNPQPEFGKGNIRGVIGPEGANNSQKATSMIPTVLFGIPGAPFAAVLLSLFAYLNFELGSIDLMSDKKFFSSLTFGFICGSIIVGVICLWLNKFVCRLTTIPYKYYAIPLFGLVVWSCMQYTGGWEDISMLGLFGMLGVLLKHFKFSRPALLIGFILSERVENMTIQLTSLYGWDVLSRPMFIIILLWTVGILSWGIKQKRINYA